MYDAGTFTEQSYHHLFEYKSSEVSTDDVVITGVRVAEKVTDDENGDGIVYYDTGKAGYVVSIEDNDLISGGNGKQISEYLGNKLIGMRFRKANISHLSDPTIEAGDIAFFTDRKQNTYPILVSRTVFSTGNFQNTVSSAETPQKNSDTRYSTQTKITLKIGKIQKSRFPITTRLFRCSQALSRSPLAYSRLRRRWKMVPQYSTYTTSLHWQNHRLSGR